MSAGAGGEDEAAPALLTATENRARSPMKRSRNFGERRRLDPEAARRQAVVMRLAMDHLGSADAIRGFLNEAHADLGGRPLDLAMASDEGLAAVEALIVPARGG